jgi:hypothetical protein
VKASVGEGTTEKSCHDTLVRQLIFFFAANHWLLSSANLQP